MIYVVLVDLFSKGYAGIKKKILAQIRVFSEEFGNVYYTTYSGQMMYLLLNGKVLEKGLAITNKERNNLVLYWVKKYNIKKAYVRYDLSDIWFVQFLVSLKEQCKMVLEFPTIPYDGTLSNRRLKLEDAHYREQLCQHVECCTTYSNDEKVFGIPSISLLNGVDPDEHPLKKSKIDENIVLIAVASMAKWHGYERVIEGLAVYYANGGKQKVIFRLIGEGPETDKYRHLIERYNLQEYVKILGCLEGDKLNQQYNEADIAIGSLGLYKIGLTEGSPIKSGEYCIRGIPFVYGYRDNGFLGKEKYLLNVSNDDTPLEINKVIQFYNNLKRESSYMQEMRKVAIEKYAWTSILKPVVTYFSNM